MGKSGDICRTTALALGAALALVLLLALTGSLGFLGAFIIAVFLGGALVVGLLRFVCVASAGEGPVAASAWEAKEAVAAPKGEVQPGEADAEAVAEPEVAKVVTPEPEVAPEPAAEAAPERGAVDDLKQLKGVGPKLAEALAEAGITRFAQIAAWTEADVAWAEENVKGARGRIGRDGWIDQARELSAGQAG